LSLYKVAVQPTAEAEIDAAFRYLASEASMDVAIAWFNRIDDAIASLSEMPRRCVEAPESEYFEIEIRQLLVEPYRILFTVQDHTVQILHVRHTSQRWLGEFRDR
jgi:plasmid stabilization system protein ParE